MVYLLCPIKGRRKKICIGQHESGGHKSLEVSFAIFSLLCCCFGGYLKVALFSLSACTTTFAISLAVAFANFSWLLLMLADLSDFPMLSFPSEMQSRRKKKINVMPYLYT